MHDPARFGPAPLRDEHIIDASDRAAGRAPIAAYRWAFEDNVDGNRGVDLLVVLRLCPEPYLLGVTPDKTEARRLARDTGGVRLE